MTLLAQIRTSMELAKRDLDELGVTRFFGAFREEEIALALQRLQEQAAAEKEQGIAYCDNGHVGRTDLGPNQRVFNLLNKGDVFGHLVTNAAMLELARHVLGGDLLLSSVTANIARNGAFAQSLHSDQWWAPEIPQALMVNCFVMLNEFTPHNGATRIVPASHRRHGANPANDQSSEPATGPAGTILAFDARTWHGTGVNQTDTPRYGFLPRYCKPFVRQQENMSISLAPGVIEHSSPALRTLMGFGVWRTFGMLGDDATATLHSGRPTHFVTELKPPGPSRRAGSDRCCS